MQFDTRNQSNDHFSQLKYNQQQIPQYFLKNPILEHHHVSNSFNLQQNELRSNRKAPLNKTEDKRKDRSPILSAKAQNQKLKFQKNSVYQVQKNNFQQIQQAIIRGQLADDMQSSVFAASCIPGLIVADINNTPDRMNPIIYNESNQAIYHASHQQPSRNSISFKQQNLRKDSNYQHSQGRQNLTNYPHLANNRIWSNFKDGNSGFVDESEIKTINDHIKQTVMKSREGVTPQTFENVIQNSNVKMRDFKRHIPGDSKSSQVFPEKEVGNSQNFLKNFKAQQQMRGDEMERVRKNSRSALSLEGLKSQHNQESPVEVRQRFFEHETTKELMDHKNQLKNKPKIIVKVGNGQKEFLYKIQDDFSKKATSKRNEKSNIQFKVSTQNKQRIDELQQFIKRRELIKKDLDNLGDNSQDFNYEGEL